MDFVQHPQARDYLRLAKKLTLVQTFFVHLYSAVINGCNLRQHEIYLYVVLATNLLVVRRAKDLNGIGGILVR